MPEHLGEVFVAAPGESDEHDLRLEVEGTRESVRWLERYSNALLS